MTSESTVAVVIVGVGTEGTRTPLGRAVEDLRRRGVPLVGFDPVVARTSCQRGGARDVLEWVVRGLGARAALWVGDPGELEGLVPGVRFAEDEACRLLEGLADDPGAGQDGGVVGAILRDLQGERVLIHERGPRVSVVTAFYGGAEYAADAVESALDQTYEDLEVVALDDGSRDGTLDVLRRYEGNPRFRLVTQPNIGQTGRMDLVFNRASWAARGELIAWLGGDDVHLPRRVEQQVAAFDEDAGLGVCHGAAEFIDERGAPRGWGWPLGRAYDDWSALRGLLQENFVGHPSAMMRRSVFEESGSFEEGLACDFHLWLKVAGRTRFRYLPTPLVKYRVHGASVSNSAEGFTRVVREAVRLRAQVMDQRPVEDFFPELVAQGAGGLAGEAWTTLGNSLVVVDPRLAVGAYERAAEAGCAAGRFNLALALQAAGDPDAAVRAAERAVLLDEGARAVLSSLTGSGEAQVELREPSSRLGQVLRDARGDVAGDLRRWDGSVMSVDRAYVALDPDRPEIAVRAVAEWCRLSSPGAAEWAYPTLGGDPGALASWLAQVAQGADLSAAGDLLLEEVPDLRFLPPTNGGWRDFYQVSNGPVAGVLETLEDVENFTGWMRSARRGDRVGHRGPGAGARAEEAS